MSKITKKTPTKKKTASRVAPEVALEEVSAPTPPETIETSPETLPEPSVDMEPKSEHKKTPEETSEAVLPESDLMAAVKVTVVGDNVSFDIEPESFYTLTYLERGQLLMRMRDTIQKEYYKVVSTYAKETSLNRARLMFGAEDLKRSV